MSFVCRFSIFLGSLCLEHRLGCNANAPRVQQRLAPPPKRPRRNQQHSQPTIFPSVQSAVTSVDLSTSSPSFNNDLISRLADAVTQRFRQENQPSLTALQSADTPVMEIPATIPSTPPCLPSHSLPVLESAVQASHLATQPAVSLGEPSDPFISSSLSLDARVSEKIRAKIWNQEYVDFGSLIVNPIGQSRSQLTVTNAESGQLPFLSLEPAEKPRKITSIESWLTSLTSNLVEIRVKSTRFDLLA